MEAKVAAIWARVSTKAQTEQSLPSQVAEAQPWLESMGWVVPPERILMVNWQSTDILRCPQMQTLLGWIGNREIGAVGMVHIDRFAARVGQMAQIMDACKEAGVEVLAKATPIPTGLIGEAVAFVLTLGKGFSVEKADVGAKEGLRNRAKLRRLPTSTHKVYGYRWDGSLRLVPTECWGAVHFVCRQGLAGVPTRSIIKELKKRGILSPEGKDEWVPPTITGILHNPIYGGRYHALRKEAVKPSKRKGATYGLSSQRRIPFEEWEYLPEVDIVNPPLTWKEWLIIQKRLEQNKKQAQRNAKRRYLMRGRIKCDFHRRVYHGQPHHGSWRYTCPIGKDCPRPFLSGPYIEDQIKGFAQSILTDPAILDRELKRMEEGATKSGDELRRQLRELEIKRGKYLTHEAELEIRSVRGDVDPEVYPQAKASLRAERAWIDGRTEDLRGELEGLHHQAKAKMGLQELQARIGGRFDTFVYEEWMGFLNALDLMIHVNEDNGSLECTFYLPLAAEKDDTIVLTAPGRG